MNMKMNTLRSFLATFAVVCALVATAAPAHAQSVDSCKTLIGNVQSDLETLWSSNQIGGGNPLQTYTSLTSKLQNALTKLDQRKYADAKQKLQDFKDAVILMRDAAKPKLSADAAKLLLDGDGTDLHPGVNGALLCVCLL